MRICHLQLLKDQVLQPPLEPRSSRLSSGHGAKQRRLRFLIPGDPALTIGRSLLTVIRTHDRGAPRSASCCACPSARTAWSRRPPSTPASPAGSRPPPPTRVVGSPAYPNPCCVGGVTADGLTPPSGKESEASSEPPRLGQFVKANPLSVVRAYQVGFTRSRSGTQVSSSGCPPRSCGSHRNSARCRRPRGDRFGRAAARCTTAHQSRCGHSRDACSSTRERQFPG